MEIFGEVEILAGVRRALVEAHRRCETAGLQFRFVISVCVFDPVTQKPLGDFTSAFGSKKVLSKVLEGMRENLEFEPRDFVNM